jgi:hypothetical protein
MPLSGRAEEQFLEFKLVGNLIAVAVCWSVPLSLLISFPGQGGMGFARLGTTDKAKNACAIKVRSPPSSRAMARVVSCSPVCPQSCQKEACMGISIRFCEEHYEEFRSSLKSGFGKGGDDDKESEKITLQQQVALLKKQLQDSGQQPVEFVELSVARQRMQEAVQRLIGGDEAAEKDIEKWDKAIRMNPEYQVHLSLPYPLILVSRRSWRRRRGSGRKIRRRKIWNA